MSISVLIGNLLVTLALLVLLGYRSLLDREGRSETRLLALALMVGAVRYGVLSLVNLFDSAELINGLLLLSDFLYVLFFILLALHYTSRHLPAVGYWLPQTLVYLAILIVGVLILQDETFAAPGYAELLQTLLFLTATLAFITIGRSRYLLNSQPTFWLPALIVSACFGIATAGKMVSTIVHFTGGGAAGLLLTISSLLGVVATLILLIFLAANISWFKSPV